MDGCSSASGLWYRRFKPLGKVRRRVQNLRISSASDFTASRPGLDLSHNESTRLAADRLLSRDLEGYHEVLKAEGEVDFLSELEKNYILEHGRDGNTDETGESDDLGGEFESLSADCQSCSRCFAVSADSDSTVEGLNQNSLKGVKSVDQIPGDPRVEVFFQSDSRAAGMKDLVRQFIRTAKLVCQQALAIATDSFSDPELLCDLLEACKKRNLSVYLLLDHLNLNLFVSMWEDLKLNSKNFPKLLVRSVQGQTYCAKTGRKLTGQIAESFIIADWTEVLTGSYSFTWLSWQVHQSLAVLIKGSSVSRFHQEFYRLHSSSQPVPDFVNFITVPQSPFFYSTSQKAQNDHNVSRNWKSNMRLRAWTEEADNPQTRALVEESGRSKGGEQPVHRADACSHRKWINPKLYPKLLVQEGAVGELQSVTEENSQHPVVSSQLDARSNVEQLERNQNQTHEDSNPFDQTFLSAVQSQPACSDFTSTAEKNLRLQEPNLQQTTSPTHGQHRTELYLSHLKKVTSFDQSDLHAEGLFSQQNILAKLSVFTSSMNTQRNHWNYSPNVELFCDNPKPICPPQQAKAKTSLQFPFTSTRGRMISLHTQTSHRETSRPNQHQALLHSCSKSAPAESHLRPQLQTESKYILSGVRAKMYLQPVAPQQINTSPRLNWTPQSFQAVGARAVSRQASFSGTHVSEQVGWRSVQSRMNTSLGRSKSMTERSTSGFRGLPPN